MKISSDNRRWALAAWLAFVLAGGCGSPSRTADTQTPPGKASEQSASAATTPEPDRLKGDALVKSMSDLLAGAKSFTFATDEVHRRSGRRSEVVERKYGREVAVRRPDAIWFRSRGEREAELWYADKKLTIVSHADKVWTQVAVPATLDEAMDDIAVRFEVLMPMGDLLYSSPWDAFMSAESTGRFLGTETIGGKQCHHVSYQQAVVDWDLWIEDGARPLPCQLAIIYKTEPGPPASKITFRDWNLAAEIPADRFVPSIPKGFARIGMIERVSANEGNATDSAVTPPAAGNPAAVTDSAGTPAVPAAK